MLTSLVFNEKIVGMDTYYLSESIQLNSDFGLQLQFAEKTGNNISLLMSMDGQNYAEVYQEKGIRTLFSKPICNVIAGMHLKVSCNHKPASGKILTE